MLIKVRLLVQSRGLAVTGITPGEVRDYHMNPGAVECHYIWQLARKSIRKIRITITILFPLCRRGSK